MTPDQKPEGKETDRECICQWVNGIIRLVNPNCPLHIQSSPAPQPIEPEKREGEDLTEEEIIPLVEAYFDIITNTSRADRELLKPEVVGKMKIKYWEIAYDCWHHSRSQQEAKIKELEADRAVKNKINLELDSEKRQLQNRIAELEKDYAKLEKVALESGAIQPK